MENEGPSNMQRGRIPEDGVAAQSCCSRAVQGTQGRVGGSRGIGLVVGAALASLTFPVFLQFFAFLTTLLYILHAFSIYYH